MSGAQRTATGDPKFDAETVIADFLGDVADHHPSVPRVGSQPTYTELRAVAACLIERLKENELGIVTV